MCTPRVTLLHQVEVSKKQTFHSQELGGCKIFCISTKHGNLQSTCRMPSGPDLFFVLLARQADRTPHPNTRASNHKCVHHTWGHISANPAILRCQICALLICGFRPCHSWTCVWVNISSSHCMHNDGYCKSSAPFLALSQAMPKYCNRERENKRKEAQHVPSEFRHD